MAAFTVNKVYVSKNILALQFICEIGQSVGFQVEVWGIDLMNITGENDFRSFAGPGNNCLNLMWCEVLSLINNKEYFAQASSADIYARGVIISFSSERS